MKAKKILVYSFSFLPNLGGLERNSYTICSTLQKLGYQVTLVTKTACKQTDNYAFKVERTSNLLRFIRLILKVDLVIMNGGIAKPIALISLLLGKKYVPLYANAELQLLIQRKITSYLFNKAYHHIFLSEYTRNQTTKANSTIILNPIDSKLEQYCTTYNDTEPVKKIECLFVGRIIEGKGIFVLAEAIKKIKEKYNKDVSVAFAGEGTDIDKLTHLLVEYNLQHTLLGRLDGAKLVAAYKNSKVLIIPSTTHVEGNPLVLAEAVSCGTPAIVSNQQAMVETIANAGLCFKNGNYEELSEKIYEVLSNQKIYQELKENCLLIKDKFSMRNYEKNWKKLLEDIA